MFGSFRYPNVVAPPPSTRAGVENDGAHHHGGEPRQKGVTRRSALGLGEPDGLSSLFGGEPHIGNGAVVATRARDVVFHRAVIALNDVALGRIVSDV